MALHIMSEMGEMAARKAAQKSDPQAKAACAKVKACAKGKASAKAAPKTGRKALTAPKAAPKTAHPPKAPAQKANKRQRWSEHLADEVSRMTLRVRLADGTSKGFRYVSIEDRPRALKEATAFLDLKKAEREAAEREAADDN